MKIFRAEPARRYDLWDEKIELVDRLFIRPQGQGPNFNRRMFDEDFSRLFLSICRQSDNLFNIKSNSDELTRRLFANVNTRYTSRSVDATIRHLVEDIVQSIILTGRSLYFLYDETEEEKVHVVSFRPDGVFRLFGTDVQWVPKRIERHWDRDDEEFPREIRILDPAKVMRFYMPIAFKRMLSEQNRTLAVIDKHQYDSANLYPRPTYENPNPSTCFDSRVWRDIQERAFYRATQCTGWNGRTIDSSKRSGFFDCHRLIRFRRNQLLLRDEILKQLSRELSRVGKRYKAGFSVEISATDELSSVAHLNELEVRLRREEVGFKEVSDYCFK